MQLQCRGSVTGDMQCDAIMLIMQWEVMRRAMVCFIDALRRRDAISGVHVTDLRISLESAGKPTKIISGFGGWGLSAKAMS